LEVFFTNDYLDGNKSLKQQNLLLKFGLHSK